MNRFINYITFAAALILCCDVCFAQNCHTNDGIDYFEKLINNSTKYASQTDVLSLAINNPSALPSFDVLISNGVNNTDCALLYLDKTYSNDMNNEIKAKRRVAIASTKNNNPSDAANFINKSVILRTKGKITESELIDIAFNPLTGHPRKNYKDRELVAAWLRVKDVISEDRRIKSDIDLVISGGFAREVPPT